ncbi:DUF4913 domain-containing protein [Tsukamurella columbiensis]|uniref:DUF4913 domain-containing protein n=1 Tax=Tsukamurella columbiensis TaxID=128509 RepID=A0ABX1LM03_9ACTN|nr:DUF4913 domain-containing protein [Tsukamurella columbiensis]NMD57983.1 DUF4913 domain-containing protein [Tsukamurella columbiensis]
MSDFDPDEYEYLDGTSSDDRNDDGDGEEELELQFENQFAWFNEVMRPVVERYIEDSNEMMWCAEWHRHPEALLVITALWRAWEHLSTDPDTGMSVWLRDHLYPHLGVLLSPSGPFAKCRTTSVEGGTKHEISPALPSNLTEDEAVRVLQELELQGEAA